MKKLALLLLLSTAACAQQSTGPCIIAKRHAYKFGENLNRFHTHRPFDYVEGEYPQHFKWRSELGDGDVRDLQKAGGRMIVMKPDYAESDLEDARKQCRSNP